MTIRLTTLDRFQTPLLLNEAHVVDVSARKQMTPLDATQQPSTSFAFMGSTVTMVTGRQHTVVESVDRVEQLMNPPIVGSVTTGSLAVTLPEPDGPGDGRSTDNPTGGRPLKKVPEPKKVTEAQPATDTRIDPPGYPD
jgi:hypothetical protein